LVVPDKQHPDVIVWPGDNLMAERLTRAELANPVSDRAEKIGGEATKVCIAKLVPQGAR